MDLPKRKHPRLKEYDYSQNGCYFVTVCVKNREPLLGTIHVGRDALIPPVVKLTQTGEVTDQYIQNINTVYGGVAVDKYVVMPNHIHMMIAIKQPPADDGGMRASRPTYPFVKNNGNETYRERNGTKMKIERYSAEICGAQMVSDVPKPRCKEL